MSEEFDEHYWDEHYRNGEPSGSVGAPPNPHLVAEATDLAPGRALDAGCGEGAETRWLAARGWRVRAVDVSATALERAREHAEDEGAATAQRIEWVRADLTTWIPDEETFDLVCSHYVHPSHDHDALLRRLAAAVARGGTLVIVGHDPADPQHAARADAYLAPTQATANLDADRWEVATAESRTRLAPGHHGGDQQHGNHSHEPMLRDAVIVARKRW